MVRGVVCRLRDCLRDQKNILPEPPDCVAGVRADMKKALGRPQGLVVVCWSVRVLLSNPCRPRRPCRRQAWLELPSIRAPSICRLKQSSTTKINTRLAWLGPRAPYRLRTFRLFLTGVRAFGSMGTFIIEISSANLTWRAFAKCSCRQVPPASATFSLTIIPPHIRKASKAMFVPSGCPAFHAS